MAGVKGKSGARRSVLFSRVWRVTAGSKFAHLVPFLQQLDALPARQRNAALLAALEGGIAAGQAAIDRPAENSKVANAIDALVDVW